MNNNIIKVCINKALLYYNEAFYKHTILITFTNIHVPNHIKHTSKLIYREMLTTDEMLLVNNIVELISLRTSEKNN